MADSLLSGPYDDRAGVACQDDGIVRDGCAGPEHEHRDGRDGQLGFAVLVRRYQRIVHAFDDALLQVQVGYTFRHPWQVRRREVAHGFSFFCASATALNNGSIALE